MTDNNERKQNTMYDYSAAEEYQEEKNRTRDRRYTKTRDQRNRYGNKNLAQTDGLKKVKPVKGRNNSRRVNDDTYGMIDLTRVRNICDFEDC